MIAAIVSVTFVLVVLVVAFALCKAASEWRDDDDLP